MSRTDRPSWEVWFPRCASAAAAAVVLTMLATTPPPEVAAAQSPVPPAVVEAQSDALHAVQKPPPAPFVEEHDPKLVDSVEGSNDAVALFAALHGMRSPPRATSDTRPDPIASEHPPVLPSAHSTQLGRPCERMLHPLCETWGGRAGFAYADAAPNARAAFRAVVRRHARPGDTVLLRYTPFTEATLPPGPSERSIACSLWARIDAGVDRARCASESNYPMSFAEDTSKAYYTELRNIIDEAVPLAPRASPAAVHLEDVDASFAAGRVPRSFEDGEDGAPYLRVLRESSATAGGLTHLVRALGSQCDLLAGDH